MTNASQYGSSVEQLGRWVDRAYEQARTQSRRIDASTARFDTRPNGVELDDPDWDVDLLKPDTTGIPKFMDLFEATDAATREAIGVLDDQTDAWVKRFFPNIDSGFQNIPETLIADIVGGQDTIATAPFEERFRAAEVRTKRVLNEQRQRTNANFTSRGFSLPPGATAEAMLRLEENAAETLNQINVEIMTQEVQLRQQLLTTCLQLSVSMRTGMMSSLAQFLSVWSSLPDRGLERARVKAAAQSSLFSSLAQYKQIDLGFEELRVRNESGRTGHRTDVDRLRIAADNSVNDINAAVAEMTKAFADLSATATASLGTLTAQVEAI